MVDQETQAASSPANPLESLTSEQRGKWLETGDLPEPAGKPAPEDSATSDTPKAAVVPASEHDASPPAAEAGKSQETPAEKKGTPGLDRRLAELLAKNKVLESELANFKGKATEPPKAVTPEATAGGHPKGIPKPTLEDTSPDGVSKWATYEDFLDARAMWNAEVSIASDARAAKQATAEAEMQARNKEVAEGWAGRVAEATKRHPDFAEVALDPTLPLPEGSIPDAFVLESEHGAEVLYHLGQNREELDRILSIKDKYGRPNLIDQIRQLVKIEISLSPNGATPPAKKVTSAPRPPTELGSGNTMPGDAVEVALKDKDFLRYQAAMNSRERGS